MRLKRSLLSGSMLAAQSGFKAIGSVNVSRYLRTLVGEHCSLCEQSHYLGHEELEWPGQRPVFPPGRCIRCGLDLRFDESMDRDVVFC